MITAALVGNPNVGKTSLFNHLTGSNQYVGNWPGVTVEKKEGYLDDIRVVDLPGIYAMDTYSNEEKVAKNFLLNNNPDVIINIVDASNLNRNLYLTTQLKQFKKPIILVLNMMDSAEQNGINIDIQKLSKALNVMVIPVIATKNKGIDILEEALKSRQFEYKSPEIKDFNFKTEKDTYSFIKDILDECITMPKTKPVSYTERIDRIVLNRFIAYPVFLLALFIIFKFTFSWVGQPIADGLGDFLSNTITPYLKDFLSGTSSWFSSLLIDGILAGVGSVIVFFPIIFCLFLGISFLEDSGYMARGALIMDKLMRKMGLSGKAFIPLVVGFGCSVPAIMSSRTLESEKDRKLTALLIPLMSCNARLPIYALFAAALFEGNETEVVFSLYLLGIIMAFIIGLLFKNTIFKKDEEPFIIELPKYNVPDFKSLFIHTWEKARGFLRKAGTIIFSMSVIIWFLSNFNLNGMVPMNESILFHIGNFISPVFSPMGYGSWQNTVSLIAGLMAKEIVIGTMGIIYGNNLTALLPHYFNPVSAYSFLVFVLLYTPCISAISTMKKEYGGKMTALSVTYQFILAWIVSLIVFRAGSLIF